MFGSSNQRYRAEPEEPKLARDETLCDVLHVNLCPKMRCCSFTAMIVIVNMIVYFISLTVDGVVNSQFLAPNPQALERMGWQDAAKIKSGQIWRLITPVFLHASFVHIMLNSFSTLVIGSGLENGLGAKQVATVYFLSAFGGILFSCIFSPERKSVGASTGIFGLIGFYIAYLYTDWDRIGANQNRTQQCALIMFTALILLFNIQISAMNPQIDSLGHLGGLIVGIIMGFVISENNKRLQSGQSFAAFLKQPTAQNKCAFIFLFAYLLVMLLIFFLLIDA